MYCIFVTLEVLNLLRSRLARLLQLLNIDCMDVTSEVLRLPIPSMEARFFIP